MIRHQYKDLTSVTGINPYREELEVPAWWYTQSGFSHSLCPSSPVSCRCRRGTRSCRRLYRGRYVWCRAAGAGTHRRSASCLLWRVSSLGRSCRSRAWCRNRPYFCSGASCFLAGRVSRSLTYCRRPRLEDSGEGMMVRRTREPRSRNLGQ